MEESQGESLKEKVRHYEQNNPCGTKYSSKPEGSLEWSEEIKESRYAYEPFVHAFAQFTRWRGKRVLEIGCRSGAD